MLQQFKSERLHLRPLTPEDAIFIFTIVNTPGFLKFIGDRNVRSLSDADAYIQKIIQNTTISYWVVRTCEGEIPIGILSLIKRDHLEHRDIGFSFLPEHTGQGYAYEAAKSVIEHIVKKENNTVLLATTLSNNHASIALLERLGLHYKKVMEAEKDLLLYAAPVAEL